MMNFDKESNTLKISNAEIFIIPNRARTVMNCSKYSSKHLLEYFRQTERLNGKPESNYDHMLETWITLIDENCDNFCDHETLIKIDGKKWFIGMRTGILPSSLFEGYKENDTLTVRFPAKLCRWDESIKEGSVALDIIIEAELKLSQLKYRYRRFGAFEECIKSVCY